LNGVHEGISRRHALASLVLAAVAPLTHADAATLPAAVDLGRELQEALLRGQPLIIMVSLEGCPFCKTVRDSFLAPLHAETGQAVVQLDWGSSQAVRDFAGAARTHDQLVREWGVSVTPTVFFFGRNAKEAAPKLVGASIPDFYGAYLEERLAVAKRRIVRG
jgi:thioredoxin-related protein